jgi:predicted porin
MGRLIDMKQIAFAAMMLACGAAVHAQNGVQVYGTVDVGLWHQSKTPGARPDLDAGSRNELHTGGIAPSVFGVRGQESIGSDLNVFFNLETHVDPSTGTTGFNAFWARAANVGLAGSWGEVRVGQQIVPALLAYLAVDPGGSRESLGALQPWALSSLQNLGTGTATPNSTLAFFVSNSISYQRTIKGLYVGALYAFGEVPGNHKANRVISVGASYTGPVLIGASFHESRWASTGEYSDRKASLGAGLPLGAVTLKLNYLSARAYASTGRIDGDWEIVSAGGDYRPNERSKLIAAYYHGRNKLPGTGEDKADSLVLSNEYSLSKRTILYAQLAGIKAGDAAGLVVSILGAQPVRGATSYVLNTGIRHVF